MDKIKNFPLPIFNYILALTIFLTEQMILLIWLNDPGNVIKAILVSVVLSMLAITIVVRLRNNSPKVKIWKRIRDGLTFAVLLALSTIALISVFKALGLTVGTSQNSARIVSYLNHNLVARIVMFIYIVFQAPIIEELCFRYLMNPTTLTNKVKIGSAILSTTLFAYAHISTNTDNIYSMLSYCLISTFLILAFLREYDIKQNMINHSFWNLFTILITFL